MHAGYPAGIDHAARVRTDAVRRLEVGREDHPGAGEYLTGDRNLVRVQAVVQYRVADPVPFVLAGDRVEPLLSRLAESSLARALAGRSIDEVLHGHRAEVAREATATLSELSNHCKLGLSILSVQVIEARPPAEVEPDFIAAQAARNVRDQRLSEAKSRAETTRTAAQAEAQARLVRAESAADRLVTLAHARADRFNALLVEVRRDRALTVRRLYRDALQDLLPRLRRKLLIAHDEPVDLSIIEGGGDQ